MANAMMETGLMMHELGMGLTLGLTGSGTKDNGKTAIGMEMASILGSTAANLMASGLTTNVPVMVFTQPQMARYIPASSWRMIFVDVV